jgi:hypothetical protein
MGQFCAVLVWVSDRRECFPMTNRFTVSRTGETGVLWLRFQSRRGNPGTGRCERFQPAHNLPAEYFNGFAFSDCIANLIPGGFTVHVRSSGFSCGEKRISDVFR